MRTSFSLLALALAFFAGCQNACVGRGQSQLAIMSYNVHNLFDATDAGSEYPEFKVAGGRWSEARYRSRLEDLAKVIKAADPARKGPDIVCLEEVENLAVLEALRSGPLKSSGYLEAILVPAPGQAVNCGILSRFPAKRALAHGLAQSPRARAAEDVLPEEDPDVRGRYLLEASFTVEGRELTVFVCHWKSKLGGAEATEAERRQDGSMLAGRVAALLGADPLALLLACGDFNESPDEYLRAGRRYETGLLPWIGGGPLSPGAAAPLSPARGLRLYVAEDRMAAGLAPDGSPIMWSPWASASGWSYLNKGVGERIDGFLLAPGLLGKGGFSVSGFCAFDADFLKDGSGAPSPYSMTKGSGFSDHLPVLLTLELPSPGRG